MKISIIDKKDIDISVENSTIKCDDIKLPFKLVDTLIVVNSAKIYSKDIIKIADNGINVIFLNSYSNKSAIIQSTNPKSADLKLKQYNALEKRVEIAKYIIQEKILRHAIQLKENGIDLDTTDYIDTLHVANNIETILGIEGSFAREYFKHYFRLIPLKFHKSKRTKRPPLDPANALLSYFYFMLYNIISTKLISYGFEPSISYLHTPFRDHMALSSDLLELYREQINQLVISLFKEKVININHFQKRGGVYLKYDGKKALHRSLMELWQKLDPKINAEIANLKAML